MALAVTAAPAMRSAAVGPATAGPERSAAVRRSAAAQMRSAAARHRSKMRCTCKMGSTAAPAAPGHCGEMRRAMRPSGETRGHPRCGKVWRGATGSGEVGRPHASDLRHSLVY